MLHTFKSLLGVLALASLGSASVGWDFTAPSGQDTAMVIYPGSGPSTHGLVVKPNGGSGFDQAITGVGGNGGIGILGQDATGLVAIGQASYPAIQATQVGTSTGVAASGYDAGVYGYATGPNEPTGVSGEGYGGLYPHGLKGISTTSDYYAYMNAVVAYGITGAAPMNTTGLQAHAQGNNITSPATDNAYGVWALASNGAGLNYGVYAEATPARAGYTYAGFFNGNVNVTGSCACSPSDEKLKKNVKPLDKGLSTVMALKPKTYDMKVDEYKDKIILADGPQIGLIAQDVEKLIPELVTKVQVPQRAPKAGDPGSTAPAMDYKTLNYVGLIPVLIKAIQELEAKVEVLEAQRK